MSAHTQKQVLLKISLTHTELQHAEAIPTAAKVPTVGLDLQIERKSAVRLAVERRDTV